MLKKISVIILALFLIMCVGCSEKPDEEIILSSEIEAPASSEPERFLNPLTGVKNLEDEADTLNRAVAIMINNESGTGKRDAQIVQAGVNKADIVYETEIEGGTTRFLAVYQDLEKVKQIGTVRSARYPFIDLALGHNAIYIHHGQDPNYAKPHLADVDSIAIHDNLYGNRISNGKVYEHTLYTSGDVLWKGIETKFNTKNKSAKNWQKFADEEEIITLSGGTANTVLVPFSGVSKSKFVYDAQTKLYTRYFKDTLRKDYFTGETNTVKNVFVLLTNITDYPDGEHRKIDLSSGDGYYVTNGTYIPIKWKKGSSTSGFKFTNTDGTELTVSAGNSWVCIASKKYASPKFE